jgi:hypothetical protein
MAHDRLLARRFRIALVHRLGFALLLQPVFFELLCIDGLVGTLRVLRPSSAIAPVATATAAAPAASTAPTALLFFAFLLRRPLPVLLTLRAALLLRLLGARRTLVRPALALRPVAVRALGLR